MNKHLLALLIIIFIFIISVIVFAFIYHSYNKDLPDAYERSLTHAFYTSITIQTTIGLSDPPNSHKKSLQIWVMVQSCITYFVSIGVVLLLIKILSKEENTNDKMYKELADIKNMISNLNRKK